MIKMAQVTAQPAEEALFFLADQDASIADVIRSTYENPSKATADHFRSVNEHLTGGQVKAGQMVIITPENPQACRREEAAMAIAADEVDSMLAKQSQQQRKILAERYAFLNDFTGYTNLLYGQADNYYKMKVSRVEATLRRLDSLYQQSHSTTGKRTNPRFLEQRRGYLMQLDSAMSGLVARQMTGFDSELGSIKKRMGLSSKSIVHQWRAQRGQGSIKEFGRQLAKVDQAGRTLKGLGYVAIGMDVASSATSIHRACTIDGKDESCTKTSFEQTGRAAGSIAVGGYGAAVGYGACNIVFGLPSGGSSLLWCGIVVGGAGAYLGGKYGGDIGKSLGGEAHKQWNYVRQKFIGK